MQSFLWGKMNEDQFSVASGISSFENPEYEKELEKITQNKKSFCKRVRWIGQSKKSLMSPSPVDSLLDHLNLGEYPSRFPNCKKKSCWVFLSPKQKRTQIRVPKRANQHVGHSAKSTNLFPPKNVLDLMEKLKNKIVDTLKDDELKVLLAKRTTTLFDQILVSNVAHFRSKVYLLFRNSEKISRTVKNTNKPLVTA